MKFKDFSIRVLKHGYRKVTRKQFLNPECDCNRQSSNDKVFKLLSLIKSGIKASFLVILSFLVFKI